MNDETAPVQSTIAALLEHLQACRTDYRRALGILDAGYREWRPEGKPKHDLTIVADVTVLTEESEGIGFVLGDVSDASGASLVAFVSDRKLNELNVPGEASFRLLRDRLTDGQWRLSRNYEVAADTFTPRPSGYVRLLLPEDKGLLEAACAAYQVMDVSRSTMRDFSYMADGLPVICYGAFVDDRLVGYCSSNPICRGVTEISWIVTADGYRRRGLASGLLTAQAQRAFACGDGVAYYAGSAGQDLDAMLKALGFRETKETYRFIPRSARDQWRTTWGRAV